jgi:Novel STAND NTPase 1
VDRLAEVNKLATHLADGSVALRDVIGRVLAKQRGTDRLLLFVDQWEEVYTLCPDEQTRRAFAGHLLEAAVARSVRVVLTMRGDFFGRALADRALADRLQDAVVTIGPMTRSELAETIVKPAEAVGLMFEAGLAETILDDVGEEPGSLPLLEFLLEALWKERRGPLLHYDAYQRLGRVPGAIAHRADEVFRARAHRGRTAGGAAAADPHGPARRGRGGHAPARGHAGGRSGGRSDHPQAGRRPPGGHRARRGKRARDGGGSA